MVGGYHANVISANLDPLLGVLDLGPAVLVAMVGVMLVILAALGRPMSTHPTCRRCRADLRPVAGVPEATCPGCGRRHDRRGVRWRPYPWRRRFLAVGVALVTAGIAFGAWTRGQSRLGLRLSDAFVDDVALANDLAASIRSGATRWDDRHRTMDRLVAAGRVSSKAAAALEQAILPALANDTMPFSSMTGYAAAGWLLSSGLGSPDVLGLAEISSRNPPQLVASRSRDGSVRHELWIDSVPIDLAVRLRTIHSITSLDINGVTVPVAAVASEFDFLPVELPPEAVEAIKARPGPVLIRWREHLGHFPPAVARAIVAEELVDPALWPTTGYRTELEIEVDIEVEQ
jgi:hypothetical protein